MPEPESYAAFWPLYLRDHRHPATRRLHVLGTLGGLGLLLAGLIAGPWWLAVLAPVFAYGLAWIGHFWIEHNRPATFRHPLWSLRADLHMVALFLRGRLKAETDRHL
jgi:hypothetical protein